MLQNASSKWSRRRLHDSHPFVARSGGYRLCARLPVIRWIGSLSEWHAALRESYDTFRRSHISSVLEACSLTALRTTGAAWLDASRALSQQSSLSMRIGWLA